MIQLNLQICPTIDAQKHQRFHLPYKRYYIEHYHQIGHLYPLYHHHRHQHYYHFYFCSILYQVQLIILLVSFVLSSATFSLLLSAFPIQ